MASGDTPADVASAARTRGIKEYEPVPGWQTIYFGSNHLATREKALTFSSCHARNGILDFRSLGYTDEETARLSSAERYFDRMAEKAKDER